MSKFKINTEKPSAINTVNRKYIAGFTLAEVLITLLIIGIIASIVIPNLINDTQEAEYHTAWKKAYSDANQAFKLILADNGGSFVNVANDSYELKNAFKSKLNNIKDCDDTSCAPQNLKTLDGDIDHVNAYVFDVNLVLNNGTVLVFALDSPACIWAHYVYTQQVECGHIMVDVNGKKAPNQWGKDVYGIWVMRNQLLPWGADPKGTAFYLYKEDTCSTSSTGYGCGAKYLK